MSIEIVPAIMPSSYQDLVKQIDLFDDFVKWIQIDVMDGSFVSSSSWPYNGKDLEDFGKLVNQEKGLPSWDKVNFGVDMMVDNPEDRAIDWISAGVERLVFHIESLHDQHSPNYIANLKEQNIEIEIALALSNTTENSTLDPFLEYVDCVQFMGIEKIGYQGQEFDSRVLEKIAELREKSDICIAVDGSVNDETAESLVEVGANRLVIGSALLDSKDIHKKYDDFVQMVN